MVTNSQIFKYLSLFAILIVLVFGAFFSGYLFRHMTEFTDNPKIHEITRFINDNFSKLKNTAVGNDNFFKENFRDYGTQLYSTFFPISMTALQLPERGRPGRGGGLTSVGDQVLLLTHDGQIYMAHSRDGFRLSGIEPPINNFREYKAAFKTPAYENFNPDFDTFRYNDILFLSFGGRDKLAASFTKWRPDEECFVNAVSVADVSDLGPDPNEWVLGANDWETLFEASPCIVLDERHTGLGYNHGGRITFDGHANLYLTNGDFGRNLPKNGSAEAGSPVTSMAQDPSTEYGKVIRIDLASGSGTIVSRGHRNPQGIAIDDLDRLWVVEHGMNGGDELNLIRMGNNYGWPLETYGTQYSGFPFPGTKEVGAHSKFVRPELAWLPSIAPGGLTVVRGFHELWDGDLLIGTLRSRKLVRVRIRDGRVVFTEDVDVGLRIRYVLQHDTGEIVLWTDDENKLIFLSPSYAAVGEGYVIAEAYLSNEMQLDSGLKGRVAASLGACMECHSLDAGNNVNAPSLAGIYGAPIGKSSFAGYSDAMRDASGTWTRELLQAYLEDPNSVVSGTAMPNPNLADPAVRTALVDLLAGISSKN